PHQRAAIVQDVQRRGPGPVHDPAKGRAEPGLVDRALFQEVLHPVLTLAQDAVPQAAEPLLELRHAVNDFRYDRFAGTARIVPPCQFPDLAGRATAGYAATAGGEQVLCPGGERKIIKSAYAAHDTHKPAPGLLAVIHNKVISATSTGCQDERPRRAESAISSRWLDFAAAPLCYCVRCATQISSTGHRRAQLAVASW